MKFRLNVYWPLDSQWEINQKKIIALVKKHHGKEAGGSGAYFGPPPTRDMGFEFKTNKDRKSLVLEIETLNIPNLTTENRKN